MTLVRATLSLLLLIQVFSVPAQAETTRLRVLIVADTNAENIQPHVKATLDLLHGTLGTFASKLGPNRMTIDVITSSEQNPLTFDRVRDFFTRLNPGNSDAIYVHWVGHGATDVNRGHYFAATGGDILRQDVLNLIQGYNPALSVLLTDTCSNPGQAQVPQVAFAPMPCSTDTLKIFNHLFFENTGLVDISATQAPQFGWTTISEGGLFTSAWVEVLTGLASADANGDRVAMWHEVQRTLRWNTNLKFLKLKRDAIAANDAVQELIDSSEQTPVFFSVPLRNGAAINGGRALVNGAEVILDDEEQVVFKWDITFGLLANRPVDFQMRFHFKNGPLVKSNDPAFADQNGNLFLMTRVTPVFDEARDTITLKVPANLIPASQSGREVGFHLDVYDAQSRQLIGGSPFFLDRVSPRNRLPQGEQRDGRYTYSAPQRD